MVNKSGNGNMGSFNWSIDSVASDHMTSSLENLLNIRNTLASFNVKLPTGATTVIIHIGDALLPNGLKLTNVLHVPLFLHNLLSIHKLAQQNKCKVMFNLTNSVMIDSTTNMVLGKGELMQGLYYPDSDKMMLKGRAMLRENIKCCTEG